jgi:hypothetical protein
MGYEHWGMAAVEAHPMVRKIPRDNGPIGSIKTAQSADYPQERMSIGTFYDQAQQIAQQPFLQGNTLTIVMPGKQEKEVLWWDRPSFNCF